MKKRTHLLIIFILSVLWSNAQEISTNSVWRDYFSADNVDTTRVRISTQGPKKKSSQSKVYEFDYHFDGSGTESSPFLISTPEDLIAFSNAVNSQAKYGTGSNDYYYNAHFKMTADIDMGERVAGPFVKCTETMHATLSGGTITPENVHSSQHILQSKTNNDPYIVECVVDDIRGEDRIIGGISYKNICQVNETTTTTHNFTEQAQWSTYSQLPYATITENFDYEYYDGVSTLPLSALFNPIGTYSSYKVTYRALFWNLNLIESSFKKINVPFAGTFDGDNHTISNFEMITANNVSGLFGHLSGPDENHRAYVKNLNMTNCRITSGDNQYAGAIAGIVGYAHIINCSVTNSEIRGKNAGGIAGGSTDGVKSIIGGNTTSDDVSDGIIQSSFSGNNVIEGSEKSGGIIGDGYIEDNDKTLIDNTVSNNQLPDNGGAIMPGLGQNDHNDHYGEGNRVLNPEDGLSFKDFVKTLLEGKIPDFCYINKGVSFDKTNSRDKAVLDHLANQLSGAVPVDQNLVLPNIEDLDDMTLYFSGFDGLTEAEKIDKVCSKMYEQHIEYGDDNTAVENKTISAQTCFNSENVYTTDDGITYTKVGPGTRTLPKTDYYYHITGDVDRYYRFNEKTEGGINIILITNKGYEQTPTPGEGYKYMYLGWEAYTDTKKQTYRDEIGHIGLDKISGISEYSAYYKLTAMGTKENPIVIDQVIGNGGIYDKGGQLEGKIVKFQKGLPLENWALIGITAIEDMENGWNGMPMDRKVNFLSNTEENNDFAAVEFDYTINNWKTGRGDGTSDTNYLYSNETLDYGKGIFAWSYNTVHPYIGYGWWDFETETSSKPILYQVGKVKAYTDNYLNDSLDNYISNLENLGTPNTSGSGTSIISAKWFSLANPFTAMLDTKALIEQLKGSGLIQGNTIYKYLVDGYNNAQWIPLTEETTNNYIYAGDGFMVGITESQTQLGGVISEESLYGYDYVPLHSSPIEDVENPSSKSKIKKQKSTNQPSSEMKFLCYDKTNIGLCSNLTALYTPEARNHFDSTDTYAMLSSAEKYAAEPFFIVNGEYIWHNGFNRLPYDAPIGFNANKSCEVSFSLVSEHDSIDVFLMDARTDTIINKLTVDTILMRESNSIWSYFDTTYYRDVAHLILEQGYNLGKYKIRFCKKTGSVGITDVVTRTQTEADVTIWNDNRKISVYGENLKYVEVCNTLGQKVYAREVTGNNYKFDLKTISGAYIIRVKTDEGIKTQKIVIR
ncbi:MAG: T9SS type A sorting domain-containing protein [Bacteroidales bacterium]|nr:T9SS type A sorting domain-containing protein [Candidatus Scybalousia scybalohippi]